jgi:hypothetical protein
VDEIINCLWLRVIHSLQTAIAKGLPLDSLTSAKKDYLVRCAALHINFLSIIFNTTAVYFCACRATESLLILFLVAVEAEAATQVSLCAGRGCPGDLWQSLQ